MVLTVPISMRAAQYSSTSPSLQSNLRLNHSVPLPPLSAALPPNSALVKISCASLNPVDYKLPEITPYRLRNITLPAIPAGDYTGTVVDSTIPGITPGQRVFGRSDPPHFGALADYAVVLGVNNVIPLPESVSMGQGSTLGVAGLTAYQCLAPNVNPGDRVLINAGSGGTGHFGIQIAKLLGCHVTTTCSAANVEFCRGLGADEVIDYRAVDLVPHLIGSVKATGKRFDLIVDNLPLPSLCYNAHHLLTSQGKYITIAVPPSPLISVPRMFYLPSWLGGASRETQFLRRRSDKAGFEQLASWMRDEKLRVEVQEVFGLEEAGRAFEVLRGGRVRGKIVVKVAEG
ncbi:hypothetical protein B0A48_01312 [Cryoendolithus antarcticus]|uniref:Enoyl reductase (ER) domain-containing protein n=1 Tax=Cryoendolithus antarcticus TaxID=1507870 RepID=A0A1V8TST9_9PEZI|nr:hypothetical protein B0A48_01312 [Cryoendolithus antarcticus]